MGCFQAWRISILVLLRVARPSAVTLDEPTFELDALDYLLPPLATFDHDSTSLELALEPGPAVVANDGSGYEVVYDSEARGSALHLTPKLPTATIGQQLDGAYYSAAVQGTTWTPATVTWSAKSSDNSKASLLLRVGTSTALSSPALFQVKLAEDGWVYFDDGSDNYFQPAALYNANTWYDFMVLIDWVASPAKLQLYMDSYDGQGFRLVSEQLSFSATVSFLSKVVVYNLDREVSSWVDDLSFTDVAGYQLAVRSGDTSAYIYARAADSDAAAAEVTVAECLSDLTANVGYDNGQNGYGEVSFTLARSQHYTAMVCKNDGHSSPAAISLAHRVTAPAPTIQMTGAGGGSTEDSHTATSDSTVTVEALSWVDVVMDAPGFSEMPSGSYIAYVINYDFEEAAAVPVCGDTTTTTLTWAQGTSEPLHLLLSGHIIAMTCIDGVSASPMTTSDSYAISIPEPMLWAPAGQLNFHVAMVEVTLESTTDGSTIQYTLGDGTQMDPTCASTTDRDTSVGSIDGQHGTVQLTDGHTAVKAVACRTGNSPSVAVLGIFPIVPMWFAVGTAAGFFAVILLGLLLGKQLVATVVAGAKRGFFFTKHKTVGLRDIGESSYTNPGGGITGMTSIGDPPVKPSKAPERKDLGFADTGKTHIHMHDDDSASEGSGIDDLLSP